MTKILCKRDYRSSSSELLKEKNILNCKNIHRLFINIFVYKQKNGLLPGIFNDYFTSVNEIHQHGTRFNTNLSLPNLSTAYGQKSIKYEGAKIWNNTPPSIQGSQTLYSFKRLFKSLLLQLQQALTLSRSIPLLTFILSFTFPHFNSIFLFHPTFSLPHIKHPLVLNIVNIHGVHNCIII